MTPEYLYPPPERPYLPVRGSGLKLAVHHIYCVGRNYAAHAREMGHDPDREEPFFFQKNPDDVTLSEQVAYPSATSELHPEIELVVALGAGGVDVPVEKALDLVAGYGVGLDMTRRDLQQQAKFAQRPWEVGKAFAGSAPCGPLVSVAEIGHPEKGAVWLDVNGERRQSGDLAQLIWKVPEIISTLSRFFRLAPGDLIMTGTPAGVSAVSRGDILHAGVEGVGELNLRVV